MFINEKWIKYNANPNGKYVGDCPKRAVSLAYNIPYKEAAKLLRGAGDWSSLQTIESVIQNLGYIQRYKVPQYEQITVEKFCNSNSSGCYLVICGNVYTQPNHIVCCINSDWYDSWDSEKMIVSLVWKINRDDQNISTYERANDDKKSLINYLIDVASKSSQKIKKQFMENVEISIAVPTSHGVELCGDTWVMFGIEVIDKVNGTSTKEYKTIPLSPRSSMNDLYEYIKEEVERIFSNIYKQLKNSQKMWDTVAIDNSDSEFLDKSISKMYSPSSKREVTFIEKLPMWSRRYIKNISFGRKPSYKYWIQLYKRINDPEDSEYVIIVSDDIDDIINKLNRYKSGEMPKEKPWFSKDTKNIIFL